MTWGSQKNGAGNQSSLNFVIGKLFGQEMPAGRFNSGAVAAGSTWRVARNIGKPFKRVRAHLFNIDTANTIVGAKAQISLSQSFANGSKPTIGGAASDASWASFLFSGSPTVTQAVAPSSGVPSITSSDWLNLPSINPTDGTSYPIIYTDRIIPAGNTAQCGYAAPGTSWSTFFNALTGNKHKGYFYNQTVDAASNPALFTANSAGNLSIPMMLEFEYLDNSVTMMIFGDSTKEGAGNTQNVGSGMMVQPKLDAINKPISVATFANGGATAATIYSRAAAMLGVTIPSIVYFQPYSVNDSTNYAGSASAAITRAQQMVDLANQKKFKLILETPLPIVASGGSAISNTELAALQSMEVKILQLASDFVKVLDMRDLHDPTKPGVWNVLYGFDTYHPAPAGHNLQTEKLFDAIKGFV